MGVATNTAAKRIFLVTLGSFTYAYASSIIGTTLAQPSFVQYFDLDKRSNANQLSGAINGVFQAGGLIGALACIPIADDYGRRMGLFVASIFAVIGGALQASSVHIAMYLVMRVISGLGVGALITLSPLYLAEVAPAKIRGRIVGMVGIMIGIGYSSASWIGFAFYFVHAANAQWRIPIAIQAIPPLLLGIGIWWLPESPRWPGLKMFREAHSASHEAEENNAVDHEFLLLNAQIVMEKDQSVAFRDLFTRPSLRRRVLIGFLTLFGSQAAGTQVINNYGPSLYASFGYGTAVTLLIQSGWITTIIFGNIANTLALDKFGRRPLLLFGFSGCVIALIGESVSVSQYQKSGSQSAVVAAVFFLFLEVAVFSSSIDATTYVFPSEIFPTPARAKGMAVSVAGLFLASLLILVPAPTAFANIQWKYYLLFISMSSVMIIVVYFLFPETKRKSLEEISALFGDQIQSSLDTEKDVTSSVQVENSATLHH
ncbi:mfs transporter, sp family, sugar:h+ symporter [Trichoderma arundinaceum]|uniref:Mfs transporter, sp family, sugar:h+ symporter n=1 Tax=Trichoderma arundinaceum TaxID=490622 RepID=A0A395N9Q8_TRIAR|nr:mfs transporter, sp family, sugar:h+ symporter [Trichoderma arundinaceum]